MMMNKIILALKVFATQVIFGHKHVQSESKMFIKINVKQKAEIKNQIELNTS